MAQLGEHGTKWDTRHWVLNAQVFFGYTKKKEPCKTCNGQGHFGIGFGSFDDEPTSCDECHGAKNVMYDLDPCPEVPPGLKKALYKALRDFEDSYDWAEYYGLNGD